MHCIRCGREDGCGGNPIENTWKLIYSVDNDLLGRHQYGLENVDCNNGVPDKFNVYYRYHSMGLCPDCILNDQPED
jgi:hypothetical protein